MNKNEFKCICCKRVLSINKLGKTIGKDDYCIKCIDEIRSAFSYHIGGAEITKQHYDSIKKRGYVINEELDKDRIK
ncbi:MAG: hypothetical protein ACTSPD_10130 [Promethearchaeota archaeon]